jgi:hypothetical protein
VTTASCCAGGWAVMLVGAESGGGRVIMCLQGLHEKRQQDGVETPSYPFARTVAVSTFSSEGDCASTSARCERRYLKVLYQRDSGCSNQWYRNVFWSSAQVSKRYLRDGGTTYKPGPTWDHTT